MTQVTPEQIALFRSQLTDYPSAIVALQAIEDCEGDLEDAAIALAIRAGQEPQRANAEWLDALARKCRAVICRSEFRPGLLNGNYTEIVPYLAASNLCPAVLATPVIMYVMHQGINDFCQPLDRIIE
jgi:hypothetical protein